jgi:hypothetical protein
MNFLQLTEQEKVKYAELMFHPLSSAQEIKNWTYTFLGLELPLEIIDPDSNSSPLDAIWRVYDTFKTNSGDKNPGYIMMSCRAGMKTISVAILETLLLLHFQLDIGHAASTEDQSATGLGYIDGFISTVEPLMIAAGWQNITQNKRLFKFKTPQGKTPYIKIVICSPKGMNSLHSNVLFLDELDLADPGALKEGKYIVSYSKGIYGVKVYLSTRKYAFGNMAQAIEQAPSMNYKILNWNIIDVTERCPDTRHLPNGPKQDVYIGKNLPLQRISSEQYSLLPEIEKLKWDLIKDANEGCAKCPILPVCKMRLANKPATAVGGFYKPISTVIQSFLENDPDSAEAQLMCFGPNTNILMGDGTVKPIDNVDVGDMVITHKGNVRRVTKTFERPYSGPVLTFENHAWEHFEPTIVTPEHPYFTNGLQFKSVSDIKINTGECSSFQMAEKGDYLSFPSNYETTAEEISFGQISKVPLNNQCGKVRAQGSTDGWIPETFRLTSEFGWIVGYFLTRGFFARDRVGGSEYSPPKGITFCSDIGEKEYHNKVRSFATALEFNTSEFKSKCSNDYTIDIHNSTLSQFFYAICDERSGEKKLNSLLMNANVDFLRGVLNGFDAGNATKRQNSCRELETYSPYLSSQLFLIAGRLGLCPSITRKPSSEDRKQLYQVHCIDLGHEADQKGARFVFKDGYNQYRLDGVANSQYEGLVYNIEVEEDHSYIADGVAVHNCWRPGSTGLVYPRFNPTKGNVITLKEAYETLMGRSSRSITEVMLLGEMKKAGILFYAGVDFGYTHDFVICITAVLPNGDVWLVETYAAPGMEFADQLEVAKSFRDKYQPHKWYADQAMPSHIKSFRKNGMVCPKFTKDVLGGIEALRSKIVSGYGARKFKVVDNESNKKAILAISRHRFILDGQGNATLTPDDARGIADICDTLRYIGQNCFPVKGPQKPEHAWIDINGQKIDHNDLQARAKAIAASGHESQMRAELARIVGNGGEVTIGTGKKGGFFFNF